MVLNNDAILMGECFIKERDGKYCSKSGYSNYPVIHVSWFGAVAFCQWLSDKTGEEYKLSTEAEWEYEARSCGSEDNRYAGTDDVNELYLYSNCPDINFDNEFGDRWDYGDRGYKDGYAMIAPVCSYKPNNLGLYDISGNVWDWCNDWYDKNYYNNSLLIIHKALHQVINVLLVVAAGAISPRACVVPVVVDSSQRSAGTI